MEKWINPNTYNWFSGNISFFIHKKASPELAFFAFFYFLAIEEIDKLMVNVKRFKGRERV